MTSTVIASRITEAREARAMSMEDLAENIGVTRQSVSKYEKGIVNPSPEILQAISYALSFPTEFFYKTEQKTLAGSSPLFFRSNSNIAKKVKNACKYQIKWTDEILVWNYDCIFDSNDDCIFYGHERSVGNFFNESICILDFNCYLYYRGIINCILVKKEEYVIMSIIFENVIKNEQN